MSRNRQQRKHNQSRLRKAHSVVSRYSMLLAKWMLIFLGLLHSMISVAAELTVDSRDQLEISKIKSAYLYNFLKYVKFNHGEQDSNLKEYNVCILGSDPFGSALDAMSGRTAKGVSVNVKRVKNIIDAKTCHIVYVSESEQNNLSSIIESLQKLSILTVSDIDNFVQAGGIIGFIGENKKIGIEINLTNARLSNIRISALLLEIAKITD